MDKLGLDLGTKHIVLAWRENSGNIRHRYEVNGYMVLRKDDAFTEQLLIKNGVSYVPHEDNLIAIGSKAEKLAYMFNKTLCRPMAEGGVSKFDEHAQEIMAIIIKSIIESAMGKQLQNGTTLYYCTTAKPINSERLNIDFHKKVVKLMIEAYAGQSKINAHHINEARCLIMEEPGAAIGISWGAGTVTVHAGYMGVPIFEFSIVGAGDWVDVEAAKRFGYDPDKPGGNYRETPTTIAVAKHKIDLAVQPDPGSVDQAVKIMYEILVENVVRSIVRGFNDNRDKIRFSEAVPVINAGGTCMPKGFIELLRSKLSGVKHELCVPIGDIKIADDPLFAVARGCLLAAELHKA
jgi:hypothetical protein